MFVAVWFYLLWNGRKRQHGKNFIKFIPRNCKNEVMKHKVWSHRQPFDWEAFCTLLQKVKKSLKRTRALQCKKTSTKVISVLSRISIWIFVQIFEANIYRTNVISNYQVRRHWNYLRSFDEFISKLE